MVKRGDLTLKRSVKGIERKFEEALKIIGYSIILVEYFDVKEFNNVIAGQLRLMLCDTSVHYPKGKKSIIDNSLIKKIDPFVKLYPVKKLVPLNDKNDNAFIPSGMFNYEIAKIDLSKWRDQCILKINLNGKSHELTILDFIKGAANKSGGAHVDESLQEKFLIVDIHSDRVLVDIAKGLFKSIERDFDEILAPQYVKNIVEKIQEA